MTALGGRPSPIRVLLAEDEEHLGTILETFLRGRGIDVRRVRDGAEALALLQRESVDVALLDVVMPEMDGLEVLRALGTLPSPPEAVVMTGNGTVDTALTALQLGAYDYLTKPYRMAEVDLLVRRAAEKRTLRLAAAQLQWTAEAAPATFLTRDPALRTVLSGAEATARAGSAPGWLIAGPPGSGRRALARWLHSRAPQRRPHTAALSAPAATRGWTRRRCSGLPRLSPAAGRAAAESSRRRPVPR